MNKLKPIRKPIAIYSTAALALASLFCAASVQSRPTRYEISLEWPGEEPGTPGDRTGGGTPTRYEISLEWPGEEPGTPGDRTGGGTRRDGTCQLPLPPAALVYARKPGQFIEVWGTTSQESAKLWIYLPVPFSAIKAGTVSLSPLDPIDGEEKRPIRGKDITQNAIAVPNQPGIVSVQLPDLQPNQMYKWRLKLTIDCGSSESSPIHLHGGIKRVELPPEIKEKLESAQTDFERFKIYEKAGIWYDAMTTLATLRRNNPDDPQIKEAWVNLLKEMNWNLEWERFSDITERNQQKQVFEKLEETIAGAEILSP
ncbi:MAG: DUF928 domain-containing protein [Actinomycetota bacterium]